MFPHWTITLTLAVILAGLGIWGYLRFSRRSSSAGLDDRYNPERVLTAEQAKMLDYLRETFPGQGVVPNVTLRDMLSVRRAADPQRAQERLRHQKVDFVVCDGEGRPSFAFDVEQYHLSDAKARAHQVKIKNRILKTAGVRFVFLKSSIRHMPSPAEFRRQLNLAALQQPQRREEPRESARQQLESQLSEFDQCYPATGFPESEVMGLSVLMELDREANHDALGKRVARTG